jgi:DNA polymerase III sliding clamp (beta) subunit (PCNA family)
MDALVDWAVVSKSNECSITTNLVCKVYDSGCTVIPQDILKLVNKIKSVYLTIEDSKITADNREITFSKIEAPIDNTQSINRLIGTISEKELAYMLEVSYAASKDGIRPVLKGINITGNKFCACDGYRLSIRKAEAFNINADITLAPAVWQTLLKLITKNEHNVKVFTDSENKRIGFKFNDLTLYGSLIAEAFLKYESIIPDEFSTIAKIKQAALMEELSIIKDIEASLTKLTFTEDQLVIVTDQTIKVIDKAASIKATAKVEAEEYSKYLDALADWRKKKEAAAKNKKAFRIKEPVQKSTKKQTVYIPKVIGTIKGKIDCLTKFTGKDTEYTIAFNPKYLTEAIKLQTEEIIIGMNRCVSPIVVTKDYENLELILPIRISNS